MGNDSLLKEVRIENEDWKKDGNNCSMKYYCDNFNNIYSIKDIIDVNTQIDDNYQFI